MGEMTIGKAIEKMKLEQKRCCVDCIHPQQVGWCKEVCQLPEAYDMAIKALKLMEEK